VVLARVAVLVSCDQANAPSAPPALAPAPLDAAASDAPGCPPYRVSHGGHTMELPWRECSSSLTHASRNHGEPVMWAIGDDVFVVGNDLLHTADDGATWDEFAIDKLLPDSAQARDVWGSSVDDVYAVGSSAWGSRAPGFIARSKDRGASWQLVKRTLEVVPRRLFGTGPTDIFAWGPIPDPVDASRTRDFDTMILHSRDHGTTWTSHLERGTAIVRLVGVAGDVWAVNEATGDQLPLCLHFDGRRWSRLRPCPDQMSAK